MAKTTNLSGHACSGTVSGRALTILYWLSSLAIERTFIESDDAAVFTFTGSKVSLIGFNFQRSGMARAQIGLKGQGKTRGTSTGAGAPTVTALDRFSQSRGAIRNGGGAIPSVTVRRSSSSKSGSFGSVGKKVSTHGSEALPLSS